LLGPRIPISGASTPATSFGLPIWAFTKQFVREADQLNDGHDARSIEKRLNYFVSYGEEQPLVIDDNSEFYKFCSTFHLIPTPIASQNENVKWGLSYEQTRWLINHSIVWFNYWEKKTKINLKHYFNEIKLAAFRDVFPLFLFYIEIITMILTWKQMEGLHVRCQWFIKFANTITNLHNAESELEPQEDLELYKLAQAFSFTEPPRSSKNIRAALWKFVAAWARTYRPRIFPKKSDKKTLETDEKSLLSMSMSARSLINSIFAGSIYKLTQQIVPKKSF
jgi:hypothetical protein